MEGGRRHLLRRLGDRRAAGDASAFGPLLGARPPPLPPELSHPPAPELAGRRERLLRRPDHEYPSYLELRLTATDASGLSDAKTLQLDPKTVVLSFASSPPGLQLVVGGSSSATPFPRTVIEGSNNGISAPSPQTLGGTSYDWASWSDGGARSHNVVAGVSPPTYRATYEPAVPASCPKGQYLAEYFANPSMGGSPTFSRCEPTIANSWASGGPGNGVGADGFSVRWTGRFDVTAGSYSFTVRADDGVRLRVDREKLVNAWVDHKATTYRASKTLAAGEHEVKLEYYENGGDAVAELAWRGCAPGRWVAEYFNNRMLTGTPTFSRCDQAVNFDWGRGGPRKGVATNSFSARWVGRFSFQARTYRFMARTSDGIRLTVDGSRVITQWPDHHAHVHCGAEDERRRARGARRMVRAFRQSCRKGQLAPIHRPPRPSHCRPRYGPR
jgi:hypothetical protein